MDFKKIFTAAVVMCTVACVDKTSLTDPDENIIGVPVAKLSSIVKIDGSDSDQIAIFDDVTRKIHQFRLSDMTYLRSLQVNNPEKDHVVVAQEKGNFVIDMYDQHLAIFDKNGNMTLDPITFAGTPVSVAFRSDLSLFIMYDNLNSVGIMQMNSLGEVDKSWVGGPLLGGAASINAGDLLSNGNLVLSLDDGTIAIVDIEKTLAKNPKDWVFTKFNSGLSRISWIAPVKDNVNQIFIKGDSEFAIYDLVAKTKVASLPLSGVDLEKISKSYDAHAIARSSTFNNEINLYYPLNSQILKRSLQKQGLMVLSSQLDIAKDQWSFVESTQRTHYYDNRLNQYKKDRVLKVLRPSDLAALVKTKIADEAQILLSALSMFALFPSDLGYAVRYDIKTGAAKEAKFFNIGHVHR